MRQSGSPLIVYQDNGATWIDLLHRELIRVPFRLGAVGSVWTLAVATILSHHYAIKDQSLICNMR